MSAKALSTCSSVTPMMSTIRFFTSDIFWPDVIVIVESTRLVSSSRPASAPAALISRLRRYVPGRMDIDAGVFSNWRTKAPTDFTTPASTRA